MVSEMKQHTSFTSVLPESYHTNGRLDELNRRFEGEHPDRILQWSFENFGSDVVLGTGFGPSGVFLIHRIHKLGLGIPIFYLDTQLLFEETYQLRDTLEEQFGVSITRVTPELTLDEQADQFGDELWNKDPDQCCHIRKVAPLRKHLADKKGWITGLRRDQSATRKNARILEYDRTNDVIKLNPLAEWKNDAIWEYIRDYNLPYNPLHDEGYPSIGCIPCTSPVRKGEDERNGRWRGNSKMECGIHFSHITGKFERNS
jgi:phosphoadenosine phosphosulfate reductase